MMDFIKDTQSILRTNSFLGTNCSSLGTFAVKVSICFNYLDYVFSQKKLLNWIRIRRWGNSCVLAWHDISANNFSVRSLQSYFYWDIACTTHSHVSTIHHGSRFHFFAARPSGDGTKIRNTTLTLLGKFLWKYGAQRGIHNNENKFLSVSPAISSSFRTTQNIWRWVKDITFLHAILNSIQFYSDNANDIGGGCEWSRCNGGCDVSSAAVSREQEEWLLVLWNFRASFTAFMARKLDVIWFTSRSHDIIQTTKKCTEINPHSTWKWEK